MTDSLLSESAAASAPPAPDATGGNEGAPAAAPAAAPAPEGEPGTLTVTVDGRDIDLSAFAGEDGAVDHAKLAGAWAEASAKLAEAAAPDSYDLNEDLVSVVTGGKGAEDDPVFKAFLDAAQSSGLNQTQFDAVLGFAKTMLDGHDGTAAEARAAELSAVQQHFGQDWKLKLGGIAQWGEKTIAPLGQDLHDAFMGLTSTAAGVRLAEAMMSGRVARLDPAVPPTQGSAPAAPGLTEAKLKEMMDDPRYWRDKDPALVRQVQEGFEALYPS